MPIDQISSKKYIGIHPNISVIWLFDAKNVSKVQMLFTMFLLNMQKWHTKIDDWPINLINVKIYSDSDKEC